MHVEADLEARVLAQFDDMVKRGKIFYDRGEMELHEDNGIPFEFITSSMLVKKPILAGSDPRRTRAGGPFDNPDPDEVITDLGTTHRLLLNKYCFYRPMLVIPTSTYFPQTSSLELSDIEAVWSVLQAFSTPSIIIYNCGVNAGSSQGHKHLQIFPLPAHALWPSTAPSSAINEVAIHLPSISFKHYVQRLPLTASAAEVLSVYQRLLGLSSEALAASGSESRDYNVAITREWVVVIPRRTSGPQGPYGGNTAGMLGMVAVPDRRHREWWGELGYARYLAELGVPIED